MSRWEVDALEAAAGGFHLGPVRLSLDPAESVAVLGRSGAGKTTFLRALAGLTPLTSGRIRRGPDDVSAWPAERRGSVYVPQGLGLFPHRTVRRNVAYPLEITGRPNAEPVVAALLERFGLGPLAGRSPSTLSTGEQQRVALARALAAEPELLLWDEPLGALDLLARDELLGALREARESTATPLLFVTHDPALAFSLADRWLVLNGGRVGYLGPPGPLIDHPPDRFLARFTGFENVYSSQLLRDHPTGPLREALAREAGPEGVALGTPTGHRPMDSPGEFFVRVQRVEPLPYGFRVEGESEGLPLRLLVPYGDGPAPAPGGRLAFQLAGVRVAPIGVPERSTTPVKEGA